MLRGRHRQLSVLVSADEFAYSDRQDQLLLLHAVSNWCPTLVMYVATTTNKHICTRSLYGQLSMTILMNVKGATT